MILLAMGACNEPAPRKPVQKKSGHVNQASISRNKKLIAAEEVRITELIAADTLNTYTASATGFWYYKDKVNGNSDYYPKTNDEVLLQYNVLSLEGDTIYKKQDIGLVQHAVDKSQLFPGLRNAVKLLKEGESGIFLFPSAQAYGFTGDNKKIAPTTPICTNLEILKIIKHNDSLN